MQDPSAAPETGEFRRSPVVQVLWDIVSKRFSGTLVIEAPPAAAVLEGESMFAFADGRLTQARLAQPLDTLGAVLHEQGHIDSAQLDASLMKLSRREGLQGEILVAMGACSRETVEDALREQLRRKLLRLFGLVHGRYALHAGSDLLLEFGAERFPVDALPLLWLGVRAHPRHPAIDVIIGRLSEPVVRLRHPSARKLLRDSTEEHRLLDALERGARVDELLATGHAPLLVKPALYFFTLTRQLERMSSPGVDTVPPRASQPGAPIVRPSQIEVPTVAPMALEVGVRRISSSNLPEVKGPSIASLAQEAHAVGAAPQGDLRARIAEAEAFRAHLDTQTFFEMLGITPDSKLAAVSAAFRALALRWHPESAAAHSPALRETHARIFALLCEAEATLSNPSACAQYLHELAAGVGTPRARRARAQHQTDLARADQLLQRRSLDEAERVVRAALTTDPREPAALTLLAAILLEQNPDGPYDEVKRALATALEKQPEYDRAHVVAAQMYRRLGAEKRALGHYVKAYQANPRNVEAVRELRLAIMRRRDNVDNDMVALITKALGLKG